ncbi:MAG: glycosyltransferase [Candidatus Curtissbacteria bacterium]|nr:glycosyltransferase [Candidatus Curtissbacteria bacterium]
MISIVVPTYNEKSNIKKLLSRIEKAIRSHPEDVDKYEIVVIDDNSKDGTWEILQREKSSKIKVFRKEGKQGKAYSLVEGFKKSSGNILVMIDADLQYPPEAIPQMLKLLDHSDIVVANRETYEHSRVRKTLSRIYKYTFGKILFGLSCDVQSGLKAFKREVYHATTPNPKSPWSFDLEFLHKSKNAGFTIKGYDIVFDNRKTDDSKIGVLRVGTELAINALVLRTKNTHPLTIPPKHANTMHGAGVGFKSRKYVTHSTLPHYNSALQGFVLWQKLFILTAFVALVLGLYLSLHLTALIIIGTLSAIYFLDVLFSLFLIVKSLHFPPELTTTSQEINSLKNKDLPIYSILCPLYKEANILPQFLDAIANIDWPKEKLDVLLLLEEDDQETVEAVKKMDLPSYIRTVVVPDSQPKTKPKACNYGLSLAKGEYLVIYDAEDRPEPFQLKKAFISFKKNPKNIICLQAKLNYYNPHQNLLTRLFTAEYSLWFDVILPGLQSIKTTIPLGGTSNHFKTPLLKELHGWDPFNVTEDADLGARLFKHGYKTAIIDSVTLEEANSRPKNWLRQRSRWIKGYFQTYLVHMRNPIAFVKEHKFHALIFQLIIGARISFMLINPFLWALTILYFVMRARVGAAIEALYPAPIFYIAVISLVFGNFMYIYNYMIGSAKRGHYAIIKYVFLIPVYWLMASVASFIALYQLIVKPHYWEKTVHGFHLEKENDEKLKQQKPVTEQIQAEKKEISKRLKFRELIKSGTFSGGLLVSGAIVGNVLNFAYNAYLARTVSTEDFGLISLIGSFLFLTSIPLNALARTVCHKSAFYLGKHQIALKGFWAHTRKRAILVSLIVTTLWIALTPLLAKFFHSPSYLPFILFAPVWIIGAASAVDGGFLSGNLKFKVNSLILVTDPLVKLILTFALITLGYPHLVYAAIPLAVFAYFLIGWFFASSIKEERPNIISHEATLKFPRGFFVTSILMGFTTIAFLTFDIILAKHFLAPVLAGQYALMALFGKMIYFVGNLFNQFINPLVSREEGASRDSKKVFYKLFLGSTLAGLAAYIGVGVLGFITAPLLLGEKAHAITHLLPAYGIGMLAFSISTSIVTFYQIRKNYIFAYTSILLAFIQIAGIYLFHDSLEQMVSVMAFIGGLNLGAMLLLHFAYKPFAAIVNNLKNLKNTLSLQREESESDEGKRILIFNWRDTKHVWAGGAEVYVHELSKKMIEKGYHVTVFCSNDRKSTANEFVDGVEIIRRGGHYTLYIWAFFYYITKLRGKYDLIIDSENGIPFFTPLYVRKPLIGLIHHVHLKEVFDRHLPWPLAKLAHFLESKVMPIVYRNTQIVTVSNSSKEEIEKLGLGKKISIVVIHPGVDLTKFRTMQKTKDPSIVYLGRLKPYKSVDRLITAFSKILKEIPNATLTIAGDGESRKELEILAKSLRIEKVVKFVGKVSEQAKVELLGKAWIAAQPSKSEGWGITVIEANACGTPVIASDIPGLRDSVKNPHTGLLVTWDNQEKWAEAMTKVIKDERLRKDLSEQSLEWSKNFNWEKNAEQLIKVAKLKNE